jgi:hypothetical protein
VRSRRCASLSLLTVEVDEPNEHTDDSSDIRSFRPWAQPASSKFMLPQPIFAQQTPELNQVGPGPTTVALATLQS